MRLNDVRRPRCLGEQCWRKTLRGQRGRPLLYFSTTFWSINSGSMQNETEQQLRQLSFSGSFRSVIADGCPATGVCDAYHGGFYRQCGRWPVATVFTPACGKGWCAYGILCRRIIISRLGTAGAVRRVYFLSRPRSKFVGNGSCSSDRRWSGGYLVRARGDSRRGCCCFRRYCWRTAA